MRNQPFTKRQHNGFSRSTDPDKWHRGPCSACGTHPATPVRPPDQLGQAQLAHCTCPTNSGRITWSYCNSVQATQPESQVLSIDATMEPQAIDTTSSNVVSSVEAINTYPTVTPSKWKANHSLLVATIDAVTEPITIQEALTRPKRGHS